MNCNAVRPAPLLLVAVSIISSIPARAETQPEQAILPVPYYSQGDEPYCASTVARMALACVMYLKEPLTLRELVTAGM